MQRLRYIVGCILAVGLIIVLCYAVFLWFVFLPLRLALSRGRSRAGVRFAELTALASLATAALALLRSSRGDADDFPEGWHACANPQCSKPIPNTTRRKYCGEPCRNYSRRLASSDRWGDVPWDDEDTLEIT